MRIIDSTNNLEYEYDSPIFKALNVNEITIKSEKSHTLFNVAFKAYNLALDTLSKKDPENIKGTDLFLFRKQQTQLDDLLVKCLQEKLKVDIDSLMEDI